MPLPRHTRYLAQAAQQTVFDQYFDHYIYQYNEGEGGNIEAAFPDAKLKYSQYSEM
ncbi:hypothetical protein [Alkalimarinus coralli]|uniref:hypothetical protein n=1 Tax=Alkalimarinus coralli TaxID=2935863 RepID=UPI00202B5753|nr:hypothetical protein [Alkalimarinus coralli]